MVPSHPDLPEEGVSVGAVIIAGPKDRANAYRLARTLFDRVDELYIDTYPGGAARARNHGFQTVKTDILWFLDGDLAAVEGDLMYPAGDPSSDYWLPGDWGIAPQADTWWTRVSVWGTRHWGRAYGFCWGPMFALRRNRFTEMAQGPFDPTAMWEDTSFSLHLIRHRHSFALAPVKPILGRATTPPWPYFLPGDHASSKYKPDPSLNSGNRMDRVNP